MKKNGETAPPKPVLSVAAFCMRVLDGNDGCFSAVKLLDHLYVRLPSNYKTGDHVPVPFRALISFRSRTFTPGELMGSHSLQVKFKNPKGQIRLGQTFPIDVPESATSFNFHLKIDWKIKTEGLWWLHVYLDKKLYAKMPLKIAFLPSN